MKTYYIISETGEKLIGFSFNVDETNRQYVESDIADNSELLYRAVLKKHFPEEYKQFLDKVQILDKVQKVIDTGKS